MPANRRWFRPPGHDAAALRRAGGLALVLVLSAGAALPAAPANGQEAPPPPVDLEALEDRPVRRVIIRKPVPDTDPPRYEPLEGRELGLAENFIQIGPGDPYRQDLVSEDIRRLNRLSAFGEVVGEARVLPDGSVEVIYTLTPIPVIHDVEVPSGLSVPNRDLLEIVERAIGAPVDRFEIDRIARQVEELYRERGYPNATVTWNEQELLERGVLYLEVTEGPRVRVTDVRFEFLDSQSFGAGRLKREIRTSAAGIFSKGRLDDQQMADDVVSLIEFYKGRGYLDVEVDRDAPRISPNGREAIVTFLIHEGTQYTLRDVQVFYPDADAELFATREEALAAAGPGEEVTTIGPRQHAVQRPEPMSSAQIRSLMELKRGDVYTRVQLDRSMREIASALGELGHVELRPDSARFQWRELRVPDEPGKVDLQIILRPGPRFRTGEIIVSGNTETRSNVIMRELEIRPERPLSAADIERSRQRLMRRNIFNRDPRAGEVPTLTVQAEDPAFPGYRDVLVEVQETATRSFNIGGAVSSDAGLTGRLSIVESNFDVTDFPDSLGEMLAQKAFRGGGQTFRIEAQPGTRIQQYLVSLADPAVFDTPYTASGSLLYRDRTYREFDEQRIGLRLGAGRKFGQRWQGQTVLRAEQIDISDIDDQSTTDLFDVEGESILTGVSFQLVRNTFDHPIIPGSGHRTLLGIEQVGLLGGDYDFTAIRGEHTFFITLYEDFLERKTTLKIQTEVGYIPQGPDDAPLFERFFRGGRSFRGFEFRTISPKGFRNDTGEAVDDPVGGTWEFFLGAEVRQPVYEDILALVFFVDSGTVTDDVGFDDYRVSVGTGIRLLTPLSPAPIALDFGFPIVEGPMDEDRLFTFTIDVPFR